MNDISQKINTPKIAVITWTYGIEELGDLFTKIKSTGYNAIQFCGDHKKYNPEEVVKKAEQQKLEILAYDPVNFKPADETEPTFENCLKHFTEIIEFAKAINAPVCTIQGLSSWTKNIKTYEAAMRFVIKATAMLDKVAQRHDIILTYEACCHYEVLCVQTADELLRIYNESQAKNLRLVLDSFHMNIAEKDMLEALRKTAKLLHSYHISDSGRGGIGTGKTDFAAQYKALKETGFNGYVFFEIVIAECRPYKLPMNSLQMEEFIKQNKSSIALWHSITENSIG